MQIAFEHLYFSYDKGDKNARNALSDVNLSIESGDFFGIVGRTGSGKSTLIQHINALIPVQRGSLSVCGFTLTENAKKNAAYKKKLKELRAKVGMVFQYPEYQLFAETVYEDVAFGLRNFNKQLEKDRETAAVRSAIEKVGLNYEEVKARSPFELSGGQKRRVAIAGVLVTNPDVLVLDEPVAGLDPVGKKQLMLLLQNLNKEGKTVIIVSHDMDEVCENCRSVAVMDDGKIIKTGKTQEVFSDEKFLINNRLDIPVTVYLYNRLKEKGIFIRPTLKADDFIAAVTEIKKESL